MTLQARVDQLAALFRHIQVTRMHDVPMLHPGLQVATVGFEAEAGGRAAAGVLVTPWFMKMCIRDSIKDSKIENY